MYTTKVSNGLTRSVGNLKLHKNDFPTKVGTVTENNTVIYICYNLSQIIPTTQCSFGLIRIKPNVWHISKNYLTTNDPYQMRIQKKF